MGYGEKLTPEIIEKLRSYKGKPINPDKPLTKKEEKFVELIVLEEKPKWQAYDIAYPAQTRQAVLEKYGKSKYIERCGAKATRLLQKANVAKRYKEMLEKVEEKLIEKGLWTRENAINELLSIIEENKKEQERIDKSYKAQIDMLITKIEDETTPDKKEKLFIQMVELMKKVRNSQVNNSARLQAVQELNKMHGFNSQELIVKHDEEFEIDKKLAQMSVEELTAMLYKKDDEE